MTAASSPRSHSRRGFLASLGSCLAASAVVPSLRLAGSKPLPDRPFIGPPLSPENAALNRLLLISYQSVIVTAGAALKAHEDCEDCELCTDATTVEWLATRWNGCVEAETLPSETCRLDVGFRLMRNGCPTTFADTDPDQKMLRLLTTSLGCAAQASNRALNLHADCRGCFLCWDAWPALNTARIMFDLVSGGLDACGCRHVYKLFGLDFAGGGPAIEDTNLPMAVLEHIAVQAGREARG